MMTVVATLSFMLGFLCGVFAVGFIVVYQIHCLNKKMGNNLEKDLRDFSDEVEKVAFVKLQFKEIGNITDKQMELLTAIERPNANAAHARYKHQIIEEIKNLEDKKVSIFKAILETGIDPIITMITPDNGKIEVRMSEALKMREEDLDNSNKQTDSNSPQGKIVPLRLVKEENNNGSKSDTP